MLFVGFWCSYTDPTDPLLYYQRSIFHDKQKLSEIQSKYEYRCDSCSDMVVMAYTKHCRQCNRCCSNFDHHCKWLNNCIGYNNYNLFIWSCVLLIIYALAFMVSGLTSENSQNVGVQIMVYLNGLTAVMALQLLTVHVYLKHKGMSTFTWVIFNRGKKLQKKLLKDNAITQTDFDLWHTKNWAIA